MTARTALMVWLLTVLCLALVTVRQGRAELRYNVTPLRSIYAATIAYSNAYAIADDGTAVGTDASYYVSTAPNRAVTWNAAGDPNQLSVAVGATTSAAYDISDSGFVIGQANGATRWQGVSRTTLGPAGSGFTFNQDGFDWPRVDRSGRLVASTSGYTGPGGTYQTKVYQFLDDGTRSIVGPAEGNVSLHGMNNLGTALIGLTGTPGYPNGFYRVDSSGVIAPLPPGLSPRDINDHGDILTATGVQFADGRSVSVTARELRMRTMNDRADAVGWFSPVWVSPSVEDNLQGFAFIDGQSVNLNDRLPSGWFIRRAYDINNRGQIVGYGLFDHDMNPATPTQRHAIRLDPIRHPGDATTDGVTNFDDLLLLAANYNRSGNGSVFYETGDFNYDWRVDFDDLLILAANYNTSAAPAALARTAIPEPATLLGASLLACTLIRGPRRS